MGNQCCLSETSKIDEQLPLQIRLSKHKESHVSVWSSLINEQPTVPNEIPVIQGKNEDNLSGKQDTIQEELIEKKQVQDLKKKRLDMFMRELFTLHSEIWKTYQNHDVDSCMPLLKELSLAEENYCQNQSINDEDFPEFIRQYYVENQQKLKENITNLHLLTSSQIVQIRMQHRDILRYCESIAEGQWQQSSNEGGIRLCTRKQGNSVGILIEHEIDIPYEVLVAILTEIDLFKAFVLDSEVTRQEKIFSRNCRIGYILNNFPIISKRQAFFQGIGYSRLKTHGEVFMFTRSIHDQPHLQQHLGYIPQVNPKHVQLNYKYFVIRYNPTGKSQGKVTLALNADIGLNFLPNFILQFMVKDISKQFLEKVISIGKEYKGSQWQKNVSKNPSLFNFYHDEIEEYLNSKK